MRIVLDTNVIVSALVFGGVPRRLWALGTKVAPKKKLKIIREDPTDDPILECAVSARAGVIVSGDRDLIQLGTFRSIAITTPRQFLDAHRPVSSA